MNKEDIRLLFEYDRWANNRMLEAASVLSAEQYTRDLGGSFCSVRDTSLHIIGGEWIWLTYWKASSHSAELLAELPGRRDALFRRDHFPDVEAVRLKWVEVEKEQIEFLDSLVEDALGKALPYRSTQVPLRHLMQHLTNHSTYHRGQVALMLRQLGAEAVATDFSRFLVETQSS